MNRFTKKLATALIGLGALTGSMTDAYACGGGGGGGRGFGGYRTAYYPQQAYARPAPQPYYQQPSWNQPMGGAYGDPRFAQQPSQQLAAGPSTGATTNVLPPTVRKLASAQPRGGISPVAARSQINQQLPGGQPVGGPQLRRQAVGGQPMEGQVVSGQALASQTSGQPAPRSSGNVPATQPAANPLLALGGSPAQAQRRPAQSAPSQSPPTPSQQQPSDPMREVQLSALAALGGLEAEESQPLDASGSGSQDEAQFLEAQPVDAAEEAQPIQASRTRATSPAGQLTHVGNWIANLPNGSKVQLTLQADGNFSWVATSGEKVSNFEGNYTVAGGSLTLVRSSDNQKLIGSMTPAGSSGFTFKLTGTKDPGLNFSRS